jgi:hypothetical protein
MMTDIVNRTSATPPHSRPPLPARYATKFEARAQQLQRKIKLASKGEDAALAPNHRHPLPEAGQLESKNSHT